MKKSRTPYIITQGVLTVLLSLCVLLLLVNDFRVFLNIFYSPFSFLVLVVMILEYIILKGLDRTRMYKLENARLKSKREKDRAFRRKLEKELEQMKGKMGDASQEEFLKECIEKIRDDLKDF